MLAGAAVVIAAGGRPRRAALVALPGVTSLILALLFRPPGGAWAFAFVPLAVIALIAALPARRAGS